VISIILFLHAISQLHIKLVKELHNYLVLKIKLTLYFQLLYLYRGGGVGAGGDILRPDEETKTQFTWGLGRSTNNQVEFIALWKVLEIEIAR